MYKDMTAIDSIVVCNVVHKKANGFNFHNKPTLEKMHPLGVVYVMTLHNPKYGYVVNGYDWWRFPISELDNIIQRH